MDMKRKRHLSLGGLPQLGVKNSNITNGICLRFSLFCSDLTIFSELDTPVQAILVTPGFPHQILNLWESPPEPLCDVTYQREREKGGTEIRGEGGGTPREFHSSSVILLSVRLPLFRGNTQPEEVRVLIHSSIPSSPQAGLVEEGRY